MYVKVCVYSIPSFLIDANHWSIPPFCLIVFIHFIQRKSDEHTVYAGGGTVK